MLSRSDLEDRRRQREREERYRALIAILVLFSLGVAGYEIFHTHPAHPDQTKSEISAKGQTPPSTAKDKVEDNKTGQAAQLASGNDMQQWMPAILALFGSLIVVVVTAWLNTKALSSQIDALRFEMKALFAEFKLELHHDSIGLQQRVERLEEEERRR